MNVNDEKILPDDPKLTAYALGELEGDERAAVEAALRSDPAAKAMVGEIRAVAAKVEAALVREANAAPATVKKEPDPYAMTKRAKVFRFPQFYFAIGGLAAACFAVVLALYERPKPMRTAVVEREAPEVSLMQMPAVEPESPAVALADAAPTVANRSPQPQGEQIPVFAAKLDNLPKNDVALQARGNGVLATTNNAPFVSEGKAREPARAHAAETPGTSADARTQNLAWNASEKNGSSEPLALSPFKVETAGAAGYTAATTLAGTRLRTDLKDIASSITVVSREFRRDAGASSQGAPAVDGSAFNTESYRFQRESDFLTVRENPLSTFSADVDTGSYANIRRMIQTGLRPPADAVRIEEMLNYFPYRYAPPSNTAPFAASIEVAEAPWAPTHQLVRIGLKGREVNAAQRGAANLVFLLDVSGSMNQPNKLPLVKESLRLLLSRLRADDHVAIVTYAGSSGLALPSTAVARQREITAAIESLQPGGSTNGAMGIQLAYDIAKANFVTNGINRVILCTDGDFNVGVTNEGDLVRLIEDKAKSGVFLTALGFGMGNLKDATLQQLADRGNGNYGYVDTRREAEKLLVEQVSGTLVTIAKDVKLQVEFNPAKVASYRLIGYEKRLLNKEDFNNDQIDAGEIGAGHTVTALYEIVPVGAEPAADLAEVDELKYQMAQSAKSELRNPQITNELLTLKIRYKEPDGTVSQKLEFPLVDRRARFAEASDDFKFAAAVASFGMLLRDSAYKGGSTYANVVAWAESGLGTDVGGYRAEFVGLVRRAEALQ